MHLKILIILIVVAVVLAAPMPAVGEVGDAIIASGHNPGPANILSFLGFAPRIFTAQLGVTLAKRDDTSLAEACINSYVTGRILLWGVVATEFALVFMFVVQFLFIYDLYRLWGQRSAQRSRQRSRRNAEMERAEQVLNSHPRPLDIELGANRPHSTSEWPLTSDTYVATTPRNASKDQDLNTSKHEDKAAAEYQDRNTPENQDTEGGRTWSGTPAGPGGHDNAHTTVEDPFYTETEARAANTGRGPFVIDFAYRI